jgi:hypothetical protein
MVFRKPRNLDKMKKFILLNVICFLLASQAWAQEKCESPVWTVGDRWTYKFTKGQTGSQEVVDRSNDLVILKIEGVRSLSAYDRKTMNLQYIIDETGKQVKAISPFRNLYDFPIVVNKMWRDTTISKSAKDSLDTNFTSEFKIEGTEIVSITAGKFSSYKIYCKQTNMTANKSGWVRYWYSPEVKAWVKREGEKSRYWEGVSAGQDAELISYKVKQEK